MQLKMFSECSGVSNSFAANTELFYFQAPATLAIAVAVACAFMWGRRLVALVWALADSYDLRGKAGARAFPVAARALSRAVKLASRLPQHAQDALRSDLAAANPDMPSLPSFGELAKVFDRLLLDKVNRKYAHRAPLRGGILVLVGRAFDELNGTPVYIFNINKKM